MPLSKPQLLAALENLSIPSGSDIGNYWSKDNAQFEASKPTTLDRFGRSINPMSGLGSALGAMHDGAEQGSMRDMGVAALQAMPLFGLARTSKTLQGLVPASDWAAWVPKLAKDSARSVLIDEAQAQEQLMQRLAK